MEYPIVLKEVKVYAKLRIQVPVTVARSWGLKDGDTVQWIQYSPGTIIVEPKRPRFRQFVP